MQSRPSLQLHWDKDEEMRISAGIFVHPHLSTVTYLTDGGGGGGGEPQAPTVVFDGGDVLSRALCCCRCISGLWVTGGGFRV